MDQICPVGNLIDFGSDQEDLEDDDRTPIARMSPASMLSTDSSPITSPDVHSSTMSSSMEQNFEGVAHGYMNGTHSLIDSPLTDDYKHSKSPLLTPNGMRRVHSSNAAASELYKQGKTGSGGSGGSRRSSFNSDIENMSVSDAELHSEISEISTTVTSIHKKLAMLEEQNFSSDDQKSRLKQENAVLQERINSLEEQLQQNEERWRERYNDEKQRSKEIMGRIEREKSLELESWALKHQVLDTTHSRCTEERQRLESQVNELQENVNRLTEEMEELQFESNRLRAEKEETEREFRRYKNESDNEMATSSEIVEELSRQNDELRRTQTRPRQMSIVDKALDLEEELRRLREDHRLLKENNDELNAQLLQTSIEQGRKLLNSDGPSLADELSGKDKDELVNALKEQEIVNQKLRAYIEGILLRVIEKHPDILEVKPGEKPM